jgi:hypothetical protein
MLARKPSGNCIGDKEHNFESMLVKSTAPTPEQMAAIDSLANNGSYGWGGDDIQGAIEAATTSEYVVACARCGLQIKPLPQ